MYFFKEKGKQVIDFQGNLILSHNVKVVFGRSKSITPSKLNNCKFWDNITKRSFKEKLIITVLAIGFIWGKSTALNVEKIQYKKDIKKTKSIGISSIIEFNECQCLDKFGKPLNKCDECPR